MTTQTSIHFLHTRSELFLFFIFQIDKQSTGGFVFSAQPQPSTKSMHHPTKYNSTQINRGICHPQTRARMHTHTTPHNTPSMTCSRFGPTRGGRSTRTWPTWLAYCCPCRRLLPSWGGNLARPGVSLRVPRAAYPRPTRRWSCSSTETSHTFPLKCRLSQLSRRSRRYLAVSPTRGRRWPPFLRARRGPWAKRAWTPTTMGKQERRGLRAKRALTPAAVTPQGKARTRGLGDEGGGQQ